MVMHDVVVLYTHISQEVIIRNTEDIAKGTK